MSLSFTDTLSLAILIVPLMFVVSIFLSLTSSPETIQSQDTINYSEAKAEAFRGNYMPLIWGNLLSSIVFGFKLVIILSTIGALNAVFPMMLLNPLGESLSILSSIFIVGIISDIVSIKFPKIMLRAKDDSYAEALKGNYKPLVWKNFYISALLSFTAVFSNITFK